MSEKVIIPGIKQFKITDDVKCTLATHCLICGESIDLTAEEEQVAMMGRPIMKVCDRCKAAVLKMRETL